MTTMTVEAFRGGTRLNPLLIRDKKDIPLPTLSGVILFFPIVLKSSRSLTS
jgi:hypothetical protein